MSSFIYRHTMFVVSFVFLFGLILVGLYMIYAQETLLRRTAIDHAEQYADTLEALRSLYTSDVVERALLAGIDVRHDYQDHDGAIPLPATFSIALGSIVNQQNGGTVRLYSPYPFPWRLESGGLQDNFAKDAWSSFQENPEQPFYRVETVNGREVVRYARADRMRESCVNCHNTHPDTPRDGWQVGDVRGVLEVDFPIEASVGSVVNLRSTTASMFVLVGMLGMTALYMVRRRLLYDTTEAIASATRETEIKKELVTVMADWERDQSEFRRHHALIGAAMRASIDPMVSIDSLGIVVQASNSVEELLGWKPDDLVGENISVLMPRPISSAHDGYLRRYLEIGESNVLGRPREVYALHKNGIEIPVELTATRFDFPYQDQTHFMGVFRDLRKRKESEKERDRLHRILEQSAKMESLGNLAGGIAHDFNNILSGILGFTELSLSRVLNDDETQSNLNEVIHATHRAREMVQRILTFSRQNVDQNRDIIDLRELAIEAESLFRVSLPSNITMQIDTPDTPCAIKGDGAQLLEVMLNMFTNAVYSMTSGSGTLDIALTPQKIDEATISEFPELTTGLHYCLTIRDSGDGIDSDVIGHVFEPFYTTKPVGKGTGMGLAVTHSIIASHAGAVRIESKVHDGTVIRILMPCVQGPVHKKAVDVRLVRKGNEHILLVDDEKMLITICTRLLESFGYTVESALSGEDALALFKNAPDSFDLVITDLTMPSMSGLELAKKIKDLRPRVPVIVCSGYSQTDDDVISMPEGVARFLDKPFGSEELKRVVRSVLDKHALGNLGTRN